MFHVIARSIDHQLIFRTWVEARVLWDAVVGACPGLVALALMPDHIHMVHPIDVRIRLGAALSGFVRWRNHHRGERREVFLKLRRPETLHNESWVRRCIRYVHLNPCKPKLAPDPLAWPFSTHRARCGLAVPATVAPVHDPRRFHRSVSTDEHVSVSGTTLPSGMVEARDPMQVLDAVSAVTRTPLYVHAARALCPSASAREIGSLVDVGPNTVLRALVEHSAAVDVVARVLGDDRFPALHDRRLEWPAWWYRN